MVVSMLFDVDSNINMLCCMDYIYIVYKFGDMLLNATFNNISVKIGGGNWSTRRKPLTCRKLLTNFIT